MCLVISFNGPAAEDALYCGRKYSTDLAKFFTFQAFSGGGVCEVCLAFSG